MTTPDPTPSPTTPRPSAPKRRPADARPVGLRALAASTALHVVGVGGLGVAVAVFGSRLLAPADPPIVVAMDLSEPDEVLSAEVEPEWTLEAPREDEPLDATPPEPELREAATPDEPDATEEPDAPGTVVEVAWWTEPLDLPSFEPPVDEVDDPLVEATEPTEPVPPVEEPPPAPPVAAEVEPVLVSAPPPAYPSLAQRRGWEGTVLCKLRVDAAGEVVGASVDSTSGRSCLDDAALEAVRTWRFRPGLRAGREDEFEVLHRVTFRLRR